jgi:hypothetical protein
VSHLPAYLVAQIGPGLVGEDRLPGVAARGAHLPPAGDHPFHRVDHPDRGGKHRARKVGESGVRRVVHVSPNRSAQ